MYLYLYPLDNAFLTNLAETKKIKVRIPTAICRRIHGRMAVW